MLPGSATLSEITSNARLKEYPSSNVLQVANQPIFRQPGYEPRIRAYDVSPKGEAKDPERSKKSSMARARAAVRDIALCNRFNFFLTLTLNGEFVDRYDPRAVGRQLQSFLKNATRRKCFQYVIVPELHEDGAIHFHGLCNLGSVRIERAVDPHTGKEISTKRGQPIYNMVDWKLGYSTCIPIDENYERICNYLTKYVSKGSNKILGKWYLCSRPLVKRPHITLIDGGMDYDSFCVEHPELFQICLYQDVCMVSVSLAKGG